MKTVFSTLLCLCLTLNAFTQITITSADMPSAGDTIRFSTADLDSLTEAIYPTTGNNVTWDFSHLVPTGQGLNEYKSATATPYAFFFLGGNKYGIEVIDTIILGTFTITDVYDFYNNTSTKFEAEGRGLKTSGLPFPSFYADKDEIYQFPLDHTDYDSSTFDFTTSLLGFATYITKGHRINNVDGWGTIITPYDTLQALRVTTDVVATDSVNALGFGISFPNNQRQIKWLANGEKFPILEISGGFDFQGNFQPNQVRYRDIYRNIQTAPGFVPSANFTADNTTPEATIDTVTFDPSGLVGALGANYNWVISPPGWNYVNGTDNTSENPQVVFNSPGLYSVSLYLSTNFGSNDTTKVDYIQVYAVSTSKLVEEKQLKVFPNPVINGQVTVSFNLESSEDVQYTLTDVQGRVIRQLKNETLNAGAHQEVVKFGNELKGVYLFNVKIGEQQQTYRLMF
jgi:hypothetical protein